MGMIGNLCVLLDASRGAYYRDDGEDVHHRGAGDRLRHRGECGVRANPGAAGVRGINFGGGPVGPPPMVFAEISHREPSLLTTVTTGIRWATYFTIT